MKTTMPRSAKAARTVVPVVPPDQFLTTLGRRVRELRERRGMTRRRVALAAEVSERHLAHLESGEGNISIVLLRRIAATLGATLAEVVAAPADDGPQQRVIRRLLERLPPGRLDEVAMRITRELGLDEHSRRSRIALIGLRGAGKSTLGPRLAEELAAPFIELDREIEVDAGMPLTELFLLAGQAGYRRIEKRALERVLREQPRAVLSVGGGIVSQADTYEVLLAHCHTIWLKAQPEEHMTRVIAQGDLRPMAGNHEAMDELRTILRAREPLYRRADATIDTSGSSIDDSLARLRQAVLI